MKMYPHPSGKFFNPQQVTFCYVTQIDKHIFQSVFEFGNEYKVLCSHGTFEEANKDVVDFVSFCEEC
ncbi:MAG: hypothetical protein OQJ84_02510 [Xanthomonadales bacterium]|nr:hypothetical protein [Xanthomonadales bacterium]